MHREANVVTGCRVGVSWVIALAVVLLVHGTASAAPVSLSGLSARTPLTTHAVHFEEVRARLTLQEARTEFEAGRSAVSESPILNFGLGSHPVWLRVSVANADGGRTTRRLLIENPWLDDIEVHFVHAGSAAASYRLGDGRPFADRPIRARLFAIDHAFDAGVTDIYLRFETPDPLVLPIFLLAPDDAADREGLQQYTYGFIYGYLIALLAYNAILYLSIKSRRHLLYAIFLGSFVLMNVAYTGHGFQWLWSGQVSVQRWMNPIMMVMFATAGLAFARTFLDTPLNLPRTDRILRWTTGLALLLLVGTVLFGDSQLPALIVAFVFVTLFSFAMLGLGLHAYRARIQYSGYFLLASIASMVGTALTALSVWGWIDFSDWRYRAVEVGMLIDATLLALALGSQFRFIQLARSRSESARDELAISNEKLNASLREVERLATTDRLTGLWNRLHLESIATVEMERAVRYRSAITVLAIDIDHFKRINDTFGHRGGDEVLVEAARLTLQRVRESDVATRWGGEEFLVLMPNTALAEAASAAEKLRAAFDRHAFGRVQHLTISVGVAEWKKGDESFADWIARADRALYRAKEDGRNRVVVDDGKPRSGGTPAAESRPRAVVAGRE